MLQIPLQATPSQTIQVSLNTQNCTINVYQKFWGLFCDLYVGSNLIIGGVLCLNQNYIVRSLYLGFSGDLAFYDTQPSIVAGPSDPSYGGLASRFAFIYFAPSDLPSGYGYADFGV
jgi:hypothetical protein